MKKKWIVLLVMLLVAVGLVLWGPLMSNVEQPKYQVLKTEDNIELREYGPMIIAEVTTKGERKEAISEGFRLLADFIFGNNTTQSEISMTAPVAQQSNEKIAMTAPVVQQAKEDKWSVHFVMPSEYTLETLPKPNNADVRIKQAPSKVFAVIRFSGDSSPENIATHEKLLSEYIDKYKLEVKSQPVYAFYNPPWTLPFLRRNEVMIEITKPAEP